MDCDTLRVFAEEFAEREGMEFPEALRELAWENGIPTLRKTDAELSALYCVRHGDGSIDEAHPWASSMIAKNATDAQRLSMAHPSSMNSALARIIGDISASVAGVNGLAAYELQEAAQSIIHAMYSNPEGT